MGMEPESKKAKETFNPHSAALATTTFYPRWYPGKVVGEVSVDKVRGDLALRMIDEARSKRFQIYVVDDGSSEAFMKEVKRRNAKLETGPGGMSPGRRLSFELASKMQDVKVIVWTEPEKVSLVRCFKSVTAPILQDEADIVVPKREKSSFPTYPAAQVNFEQKGNRIFNKLLRENGLLKKEDLDFDIFFGPKAFKNDPRILGLFLRKYRYTRKGGLDDNIDPELWPNTIVLPIIAALHEGYRVASVEIPYRHPQEQTGSEEGLLQFSKKRLMQYKNFIITTVHYLKLLNNDPDSNLVRV